MKKIITSIYFQIGVNIIGLPEIIKHDLPFFSQSKFHK